MQRITSLDMHLKFPPGKVVETKCLEDVACGMYPCYYLRSDNKLKVSTSVVALIFDSGSFELNPNFKPPNFLNCQSVQKSLIRSIFAKTPAILKKPIRNLFLVRNSASNSYERKLWYESWETIDKRIRKLKPFEKVTPTSSTITFKPDFTINDKEEIIDKTVYYLQKFINEIEIKYLNYCHIVLTGGKDSQLISLVPKLNPERWYIFSAEPNYTLVKHWVKENGIRVKRIFKHNNKNEETIDDFGKKIICSDLYSDPRHIQWLPTLKRIAKKFDNKCIFWSGTIGDTIYSFHEAYHIGSKEKYFDVHMTRAASWQGNYHQTFKNFVGRPLLSPYHSKEIWEELYQHLDPSVIKKDTDLRPEIGERLFGKPVKWVDENPGPEPYSYPIIICLMNTYRIYKKYIQSKLK